MAIYILTYRVTLLYILPAVCISAERRGPEPVTRAPSLGSLEARGQGLPGQGSELPSQGTQKQIQMFNRKLLSSHIGRKWGGEPGGGRGGGGGGERKGRIKEHKQGTEKKINANICNVFVSHSR